MSVWFWFFVVCFLCCVVFLFACWLHVVADRLSKSQALSKPKPQNCPEFVDDSLGLRVFENYTSDLSRN